MGSLTLTGQTGEGSAAIDSISGTTVAVKDFGIQVVSTNPKTRFIGTTSPRGVWRIGTVGIGWSPLDSSGVTFGIIAHSFFVHFENEEYEVPPGALGPIYFGTVFWRLLLGVTATIYVEW